jgi:hypothetical protein
MFKRRQLLTILVSIVLVGSCGGIALAGTQNGKRITSNRQAAQHPTGGVKEIPPTFQHVNQSKPAQLRQAAEAVDQLLTAWNKKDWTTVGSLVYNTLPVPIPDNWFARRDQANPGTPPTTFTLGTPYLISNWTTPTRNFIVDQANNVGQANHEVFDWSVAVPVKFQGLSGNVVYHCVQDDSGKWKVAYSFLNGFEVFDSPQNLANALANQGNGG